MNLNVPYGIARRLPGVGMEEARTRIIEALEREGFGVLTEIDVQATLKKKLDVDSASAPLTAFPAAYIQIIVRILDWSEYRMKHREFKDRLYAQFARVGKGLASPARLELLDLLAQGERTVEALARETTLTVGNTSAHLQVLREARLVEARKEGLHVYYRLADESVGALTRAMRGVAERQLAEVDRVVKSYLRDRQDLDSIGAAELAQRIKDGTVLVLDVRPAEEYASGHIAGALSIPHDELARRMKEIPRDREVVAYCRGPYCVFADEAIAALRKHRRTARRLTEGFPEWRAAGLPTESENREATR